MTVDDVTRISSSSYSKWHMCNRMFYFEHVLRIERVREEGAAAFGKLYHAGLEAWWRAMDGGDMPWREADAAYVAACKALHDAASHIDTDKFDLARAEAMLLAYHSRYFELDFVTVDGAGDGVEVAFDIPLRDPDGTIIPGWRVTGRKDAIKKFGDGRIKVCEHKTSSKQIHVGAPYWDRVKVDMQVSIYIDAAQQLGFDTREAMYDVSRKPELRPLRKTPEEKRKLTKGKGCVHCGGRAGGKGGVAKGTGRIMIKTSVDGDGRALGRSIEVEVDCTSCAGTGWHEPPRLQANQRIEDESVVDYKARVAEELADDFDAYFKMATIPRTEAQLAEARGDLVTTAGLIGAMVALARQYGRGNMHSPEARRAFPRNTHACLSVYGARCSFLDVCSGAVNPAESKLYRIKQRHEVPR